MSELADRSFSSRSRLSHAMARLEAREWVTRRPCDDDRRGSWATLTDEGFAALESVAPDHVVTVRRALFDALTSEQVAQLGEILDAVLRASGSQLQEETAGRDELDEPASRAG